MITALQAASYVSQRYLKENGSPIDEMKLHKLLYFVQRECLIAYNELMFPEQFVAWKYGPVMLCVRDALKVGPLEEKMSMEELNNYESVFNNVFSRYARRPSWRLSTLSHGEYSWQKARDGLSVEENGNHRMENDDIIKDADRIKLRRILFE